MSETPLLKRFEQAYKEQEFSALEIAGFQSDPKLAFAAGAAVGYGMAVDAAIAAASSTPPQENSEATLVLEELAQDERLLLDIRRYRGEKNEDAATTVTRWLHIALNESCVGDFPFKDAAIAAASSTLQQGEQ